MERRRSSSEGKERNQQGRKKRSSSKDVGEESSSSGGRKKKRQQQQGFIEGEAASSLGDEERWRSSKGKKKLGNSRERHAGWRERSREAPDHRVW